MTEVQTDQSAVALPGRIFRPRREHRFYTGMGLVAWLIVILAFWPSYRAAATGADPMAPSVHLHSLLFTCWLLLYIAQTRLVATGRTEIHRRLGIFGGALAASMIVVGYRTAVASGRNGFEIDTANDPLGFMVFPLGDLISFALLVGAALL